MNEVMIRRVLGAVVLLLAAFLLASLIPGPEAGQDRGGSPSASDPDQVVRYDLKGVGRAGLKLEPALKDLGPEQENPSPEPDPEPVEAAQSPGDEPVVAPALPVVATVKPAAPAAALAARPAPPAASKTEAAGWFVQVASFADPVNARSVRDRLRGSKLPAASQKVKVGPATWYRVRVGPYREEAAAQKALVRVRALDYRSARLFQESVQ